MTVHGQVHWSELMTRSASDARSFFASVVGWSIEEWPMGESGAPPYLVCMADGKPAAGIFDTTSPEFDGVPDQWMTYVHVDDVDAACDRVKAAGGQVLRPSFEVPGVGRIAMIADPSGAAVGLITPSETAD